MNVKKIIIIAATVVSFIALNFSVYSFGLSTGQEQGRKACEILMQQAEDNDKELQAAIDKERSSDILVPSQLPELKPKVKK